MSIKLHGFHGGMHLEGHKAESLTQPLQQASLPDQLFLPLRQHIGETNRPLVERGERVLRGQLIADSSSPISAPIHAPSSGTVREIALHPIPHPSGQSDYCIVIDLDGKDEATRQQALNPDRLPASELINLIRRAGIVGLGGAAFPTSAKLSRARDTGIDTLIINGAECEPYITSDEMLMQTYSDEVIRGTGYLQRIFNPARTLIAIEDDKPRAIEAIGRALATESLEKTKLVVIPSFYPSGGEKQLVKKLTGKEVPQGQLAFDIGILSQNVGTCAAITRALEQDEALISRIVTVSGNGIRQPGNWETRLGTPIDHLIKLAGGYRVDRSDSQHLVMGGPMMGFSLSSGRVPIVKASNNILVMQQQTIPATPGYHDECVRCGKCAEVCPAQLLPQQLYWQARAKAYQRSEAYNLFDCIECGCCSVVCPSQIPLVQYYRAAKSEIRAAKQVQFKSDRSRVRFEFREKRLLLKKQLDEERRRLKREALQKKDPQKKAAGDAADPIQAALERVRAKKQALDIKPENTTKLSAAQQRQIEQADARQRAARQARTLHEDGDNS